MVNALIYLIILSIGFALGALLNPKGSVELPNELVLERSVNLAEILAFTVPLFVGVVVAKYFTRPSEQKNFVKEHVVSQIEAIVNNLNSLSESARRNTLHHNDATSLPKSYITEIENVYEKINKNNLKNNCVELRTFQLEVHNLGKPLTKTPLRNERSAKYIQLEIKDGICFYSGARFQEIQKNIMSIKSKLNDLILELHANN